MWWTTDYKINKEHVVTNDNGVSYSNVYKAIIEKKISFKNGDNFEGLKFFLIWSGEA